MRKNRKRSGFFYLLLDSDGKVSGARTIRSKPQLRSAIRDFLKKNSKVTVLRVTSVRRLRMSDLELTLPKDAV